MASLLICGDVVSLVMDENWANSDIEEGDSDTEIGGVLDPLDHAQQEYVMNPQALCQRTMRKWSVLLLDLAFTLAQQHQVVSCSLTSLLLNPSVPFLSTMQ